MDTSVGSELVAVKTGKGIRTVHALSTLHVDKYSYMQLCFPLETSNG